jgi:hypothetical protein
MAIQKFEVQRFSLITSRPFDAVVASLKAGVGQLDLVAFASASKSPGTFAELEEVINRDMGTTGLMLFLEFNHGAVVRKETGLEKPKIVRLGYRQSAGHEGDGQARFGRRVICACHRSRR